MNKQPLPTYVLLGGYVLFWRQDPYQITKAGLWLTAFLPQLPHMLGFSRSVIRPCFICAIWEDFPGPFTVNTRLHVVTLTLLLIKWRMSENQVEKPSLRWS